MLVMTESFKSFNISKHGEKIHYLHYYWICYHFTSLPDTKAHKVSYRERSGSVVE